MSSPLKLLDLPVEILSEILCQLDHIHILRCSLVCKQLHALVTSSLALQYRIELASDGLVNGQPGGSAFSTTAARMEILLERRAAWRALRPNRRTSVALAGHCHAYELVGGLFAKALEDFGAARRLVASWLPGNGRGERRFVVDDLGVRIKDFALDPSQDLIVLLEHRPAPGSSSMAGADICVHLRKLGAVVEPHPVAKTPMLCRRAIGPVHGCMIQIVDDIVGMYFWMPFHAVLIWNWTTGEELLFIQENQAPECIWDFSFLSSRAYMITTLKDGGEIHIYSFGDSSSSHEQSTHVATLRLPPPHDNRLLLELTTTTGPFLARPPPGVPFASAHDARVHVFTLHHDLETQRGRWQPACFVMHNRTLMQYVDAHRERKEAGAIDVPWEEWGPHGTRFFVLAMGFQWLRYVHGTRVVCPVLQPTGESRVEVLDFNVHASRGPTVAEKLAAARMGIDATAAAAAAARSPEGARFVCEPSVFAAETVFANEVVTTLPYHSMPAPGQCEPYVGYMIDEQRLLGLKASPFTDGDLGDVDVYTF